MGNKFLGYLRTLGLKDTILGKNLNGDETDKERNEKANAELIQFLNEKSLSLIMREATDNGREAQKILSDHNAGNGKPRIISLNAKLTSLKKEPNESVIDNVIRTEVNVSGIKKCRRINKWRFDNCHDFKRTAWHV